jgi:hypothetical protein
VSLSGPGADSRRGSGAGAHPGKSGRRASSAPRPETRASLDFSGAAEADGHFACFHQHRHLADALAVQQHLIHQEGVVNHIFVGDFIAFLDLGLPGLLGIRSTLFAENENFFGHVHLSCRF